MSELDARVSALRAEADQLREHLRDYAAIAGKFWDDLSETNLPLYHREAIFQGWYSNYWVIYVTE